MKKLAVALVFLPMWLGAAGPPKKEYSAQAWQITVDGIFRNNFAYDPEVLESTKITFLDWPQIVAKNTYLEVDGKKDRIIFLSRGFADLIQSEDELLFFLAHEIGHSKMNELGACGFCSEGDCEELAADRFAIDFLESKGLNACGGKAVLLKMILEDRADADENRLKQLREYCPSPIAAR